MNKSTEFALRLWPMIFGILLVLGLNKFEHAYMPVVVDFTVTEMTRNESRLTVKGYMRKARTCTFAGVSADGVEADGSHSSVPLVFRDSTYDQTANRPTGTQSWGPWFMEIPVSPEFKYIELESVHTCHPFWATTTQLIQIPVLAVPK